jgi:sigma-E factor negative regulatory protein RseA
MNTYQVNTNLEDLSALMDGGLDLEADGARTVEAILQDREMRAIWARYHLMGDALRNNLPRRLERSIAERVSEALATEPTVLCPPRTAIARHASAQTLFAVAASVVAVVLPAFFWHLHGEAPTSQSVAVHASAAPAEAPTAAAPSTGAFVDVAMKRQGGSTAPLPLEQRMNGYLVNYNEHRDVYRNAGAPGMLPYVRLVGSSATR